MKIYKSGYKNNWLSPYTILETVLFWKDADTIYDKNPPIWLGKFCQGLYKVMNIINPRINYIKIDDCDVWNADVTMANIIHPMLVKFNDNKTGSPNVEDCDVPDILKSINSISPESKYIEVGESALDESFHSRWQYVIDEMIFTFDILKSDEYFDDVDGRVTNGLRLFSKYYRSLWV